jgi:preprotein translocase subunit SecD
VNRYPAWKYALIGLVVALALLYTLPNFFGESPAVQVTSGKTTVKVDSALLERAEVILKAAGIAPTGMLLDRIRRTKAMSSR